MILLIILACSRDSINENKDIEKNEVMQLTQSSVQIESSVYLDDVPLVSQAILSYLTDSNDSTLREIYKMYGGDSQKLNVGMPLKYSYTVSGMPSGVSVAEAKLELSNNEAFNDVESYSLKNSGDSIEI